MTHQLVFFPLLDTSLYTQLEAYSRGWGEGYKCSFFAFFCPCLAFSFLLLWPYPWTSLCHMHHFDGGGGCKCIY